MYGMLIDETKLAAGPVMLHEAKHGLIRIVSTLIRSRHRLARQR